MAFGSFYGYFYLSLAYNGAHKNILLNKEIVITLLNIWLNKTVCPPCIYSYLFVPSDRCDEQTWDTQHRIIYIYLYTIL